MTAASAGFGVGQDDWRGWLRRKIGVLLLIKLLALVLIKTFFFSGATRLDVTPDRVHGQLATEAGNQGFQND